MPDAIIAALREHLPVFQRRLPREASRRSARPAAIRHGESDQPLRAPEAATAAIKIVVQKADIVPQTMRCEATARAGMPSRRHDDAVVVCVCLRQLADGTWDRG
jgi:hypothetical protein